MHTQRLSYLSSLSFSHWHHKIYIIKIVPVLLFIFLFIAFNNFDISSPLKKEFETVPPLCHTLSTIKVLVATSSSRSTWKCKENFLCGQRCLFTFLFTVPSCREMFDTVKSSKQTDFGILKVYKNSSWKPTYCQTEQHSEKKCDHGRCWLFAEESQQQWEAVETTLPEYLRQQCSNKEK